MTDLTPLDRAQIATDVYSSYVADLAALTQGCGRPGTIQRTLGCLSAQAGAAADMAGSSVAIAQPDFDVIDPDEGGDTSPDAGRFDPARNQTFLAAHQSNVAALKAALGL